MALLQSIFNVTAFVLLVVTFCHAVPDLVFNNQNGANDVEKYGKPLFENIPTKFAPNSKFESLNGVIGNGVLQKFKFFGKSFAAGEGGEGIRVHYNGFVTFDTTARGSLGRNTCPQGSVPIRHDFVAPYWLKYYEGNVHAFLLNNNDNKQRIVQDLQEADLLDATTDPREVTIFVITWLRMRTSANRVNKNGFLNTFQAFFINVNNGRMDRNFVQFYHRSLDSNKITTDDGVACRAQIGISRFLRPPFPNFPRRTELFFTRSNTPQSIEYYTDETKDLKDIGSWVLTLNEVAEGSNRQPQTRDADCTSTSNNFKCFFRKAAIEAIERQAARGRKRKRRAAEFPRPTRMTTMTRKMTTNGGNGMTTDGGNGMTTDGGNGMTTDGGNGMTTDGGNGMTTDGGNGMTTDGGNGMTTDGGNGMTTNGNVITTVAPTEQDYLNRFCEFRDNGVFAFPVNCQVYVHCDDNGRATFDACRSDQHFHQETRGCVDSGSVSCYDGFPVPEGISPWIDPESVPIPPLTPDACNLTTPDSDIPDPSDCSKYFTCTNGISVPRRCPSGLYFNNAAKFCDNPRYVNTETCVTQSTVTTTRRTPPKTGRTYPTIKTTMKTKPTDKRTTTTTKRQTTHKRLMTTGRPH